MRLFPEKQPIESFSLGLLTLLPKKKEGNRFILLMADRFTKLTQVVSKKHAAGIDVSRVFRSHWVF